MSITKILPRLPALAFLLAAAYLVATLFHHKSLKLSVQPTSRVSARLVAQAQGMRSQSRSETRMRALDSTDPVLLGLKLANPVTGMIKPLMSSMSKVQAGTYDEDATEELINREVTSSPVVVFSYGLSPFCTKAIEILRNAGANPKVVDMGAEWLPGLISTEGAAIRAQLGKMTGRTSMPHIYIGGKNIGGLVDGTPGLLQLAESGELETQLKNVGAI
ncbi:hypothetical protein AAMO2058_000870700 [Amorphochlora amoebiformis]|uniref:Glutaredoxin domain-containing protein n=1 Tax=Amorphochlora amoebiformis TaxID=1561963 RepID=A0A7S0CNE4_9EUKA|mmetsp:Transcript_10636/g.16830  ORF Transcript_10636/g.16830 Transcript_10636/m.16830 type:complete len:218 (+) Transcript_10636:88-741(+)